MQTHASAGSPLRLHIGSGAQRIPGFLNVDLRPFPGVDVVADVTKGLDYPDGAIQAVFAEHFLEHLPLGKALDFLVEIHRVLDPDDGWLRLSTPNLDWVWQTHYRLGEEAATKRQMAFNLNRAFHGWEHKFLWNREILAEALRVTGYEDVSWCRYGESEQEVFRGVERHETYDDDPELPHVIIAEGRKGRRPQKELESFRGLAREQFLQHVEEGY